MELRLIPGFSLYLALWQSVNTAETKHNKVSSITICFQTCSGIPQRSTASASLHFPPLVLTQPVTVMCFPTRFLLYKKKKPCQKQPLHWPLPPCYAAGKVPGILPSGAKGFDLLPSAAGIKAIVSLHQLCNRRKRGLKIPCNRACSRLFDELFNPCDTNSPSLKENVAVLNSSCYTVKSSIWKQRPWLHSWTSPLIVQSLFHGSSMLGQSHAFTGTWESQNW